MVSGMYIGEVVRNVLLSLIDRNILFDGHSSTIFNTHYGMDTALMSAIEAHPVSAYSEEHVEADQWRTSLEGTKKVLIEMLGIKEEHISQQDCLVVRRVCEIVGTRGARLSAVAIAAVLIQTGHDKQKGDSLPNLNAGVDGSLVEFYPGFEVRIRQALREIVGEDLEKHVQIGLAKDGSGIGAALSALQAKKQDEALKHSAPERLGQDNRSI